jgi:hypothetical protein
VWFGKVFQVDDEVVVSDDEDDLQLFDDIETKEDEELKHLQHSRDTTKPFQRARSGEILPMQSWRRQSTYRKQSMAQILELGHAVTTTTQSQSTQLLPPLTLSQRDKQMQEVRSVREEFGGNRADSETQPRKGSTVRKLTIRANSMENAKVCITNDLEDFIEVSELIFS